MGKKRKLPATHNDDQWLSARRKEKKFLPTPSCKTSAKARMSRMSLKSQQQSAGQQTTILKFLTPISSTFAGDMKVTSKIAGKDKLMSSSSEGPSYTGSIFPSETTLKVESGNEQCGFLHNQRIQSKTRTEAVDNMEEQRMYPESEKENLDYDESRAEMVMNRNENGGLECETCASERIKEIMHQKNTGCEFQMETIDSVLQTTSIEPQQAAEILNTSDQENGTSPSLKLEEDSSCFGTDDSLHTLVPGEIDSHHEITSTGAFVSDNYTPDFSQSLSHISSHQSDKTDHNHDCTVYSDLVLEEETPDFLTNQTMSLLTNECDLSNEKTIKAFESEEQTPGFLLDSSPQMDSLSQVEKRSQSLHSKTMIVERKNVKGHLGHAQDIEGALQAEAKDPEIKKNTCIGKSVIKQNDLKAIKEEETNKDKFDLNDIFHSQESTSKITNDIQNFEISSQSLESDGGMDCSTKEKSSLEMNTYHNSP